MSDIMFYIAASAATSAFLETLKRAWPAYKQNRFVRKLMPWIPMIVCTAGVVVWALVTQKITWIEALPVGILGGSLSSTAYHGIERMMEDQLDDSESSMG